MPIWLSGISHKQIDTEVYEINISGYGTAEVGPYSEICRRTGGGSDLEAHHIVAKEHLRMVRSSYNEYDAPSIAITSNFHRVISARIGAEQIYIGSRPRDGIVEASNRDILDLYNKVYTWHTHLPELYKIAENILK